MTKTDIFHFNHIGNKNINDDKLSEIKALYKFYHKLHWCYTKAFKHFKRLKLIVNVSSTGLVAVGTMIGKMVIKNGLLLKTISEIKNYQKKIEMSKFAYTTKENFIAKEIFSSFIKS